MATWERYEKAKDDIVWAWRLETRDLHVHVYRWLYCEFAVAGQLCHITAWQKYKATCYGLRMTWDIGGRSESEDQYGIATISSEFVFDTLDRLPKQCQKMYSRDDSIFHLSTNLKKGD